MTTLTKRSLVLWLTLASPLVSPLVSPMAAQPPQSIGWQEEVVHRGSHLPLFISGPFAPGGLSAHVCCVSTPPGQAATQDDPIAPLENRRDERMRWWREARYGMFIHWGFYSVLGGKYQGEIVDRSHGAEWIQCDALLTCEQYEPFAKQFNPVKFDADQWARIAKNAGMKYMVITSKHHDGFNMYDTAVSDYNIVRATPFNRDPLKELSLACRKYGIHFGIYYSQLDWHHPAQENDPNREGRYAYRFNRMRDGMKDQYIADMKAQLKELIEDYEVEVIFFDGEWVPWWTQEDGRDLLRYVRQLNPQIIVNNRIGKRKKEDGDYGTPEQKIPSQGLDYDWETNMTLNGTWGYKSYDHNWKSTDDLVRKLVDITSKGGNFLLNVGPDDSGTIPQPSVNRLLEVGKWLSVNGEAIYGTRLWNPEARFAANAETEVFGPGPEEEPQVQQNHPTQDARGATSMRFTLKGKTLYAVFFQWPEDGQVTIEKLASGKTARDFRRVRLLGSNVQLQWQRTAEGLVVNLPQAKPCEHAYVLAIDGK